MREIARWLALALIVVAIDQATKLWITGHVYHGESIEVTSFFNLVLAHNTGAAFSMFAAAGGWQRFFFIAVAAIAASIIIYLLRRHRSDPWFCSALGLILGGALGNLIDRVRLGYVVDFLDFHALGQHFPAFNAADTAITIGAMLIVWDSLHKPKVQPA